MKAPDGGDPLPIDAPVYSDLADSLRYEGYHHFCINVPDIEEAVADLRARGVKMGPEARRSAIENAHRAINGLYVVKLAA